ncbi:hypothetical protein S83_007913, partial [Arachis hypogaea]
FYFQHGRPLPNELKEQCMLRIDQLFHDHLDGLQMHEFKLLTKEVCKLPSFFSISLFRKIENRAGVVTRCVAGTEDGIKKPTTTFSACFGATFIMLHPIKYATMLAEKMEKHGATGWLVKTGWSGGRYGYGSRIKLPYTRKIIDAIHSGSLLNAEYKKTEIFGFEISTEVEGVTSEILDPINT